MARVNANHQEERIHGRVRESMEEYVAQPPIGEKVRVEGSVARISFLGRQSGFQIGRSSIINE